mmetsp:Transcript_21139/g.45877  ORF Transcript_21139/g.45877 Transcript_21139/m.45877 type:complete len:359 (+) Transcript_21139:19-1095(+)
MERRRASRAGPLMRRRTRLAWRRSARRLLCSSSSSRASARRVTRRPCAASLAATLRVLRPARRSVARPWRGSWRTVWRAAQPLSSVSSRVASLSSRSVERVNAPCCRTVSLPRTPCRRPVSRFISPSCCESNPSLCARLSIVVLTLCFASSHAFISSSSGASSSPSSSSSSPSSSSSSMSATGAVSSSDGVSSRSSSSSSIDTLSLAASSTSFFRAATAPARRAAPRIHAACSAAVRSLHLRKAVLRGKQVNGQQQRSSAPSVSLSSSSESGVARERVRKAPPIASLMSAMASSHVSSPRHRVATESSPWYSMSRDTSPIAILSCCVILRGSPSLEILVEDVSDWWRSMTCVAEARAV